LFSRNFYSRYDLLEKQQTTNILPLRKYLRATFFFPTRNWKNVNKRQGHIKKKISSGSHSFYLSLKINEKKPAYLKKISKSLFRKKTKNFKITKYLSLRKQVRQQQIYLRFTKIKTYLNSKKENILIDEPSS